MHCLCVTREMSEIVDQTCNIGAAAFTNPLWNYNINITLGTGWT